VAFHGKDRPHLGDSGLLLAHQCAPGLYSYWEGDGEENTFHQWEQYRGWLKPRYVTPHYWTASEMLHLQIDMLAYVDESGDSFEIVLGGGVPAAWLSDTMFLKDFRTKAGVVSWEFSNGTIKATVAGADQHYPVRLGPAFRDKQTKLEVDYR